MKKRVTLWALGAVAALALALTAFLGAPPVAAADNGQLVMERCTVCHNAKRICLMLGKKDKEAWSVTVKGMVGKGAKLSAEEQALAAGYLAGLGSGAVPVCQ